ncbi:MAG: hypothetical protein AB8G05_19790 [Oligoflexales bacterium]
MKTYHNLNKLLVLLAIASHLSTAWASSPDHDDECAIRYVDSFNYFVINPGEMKAKSGHDFPRGHETFRLQKKSEQTFEFFHPDSNKYLCISSDKHHFIPCNHDDNNKVEFELKPLIEISSLKIKDHSRISLARFFLLKLNGDFIKLRGNSFEIKHEINREDLGDITLVDVANMANLDSEPHIFDFIHAFQGILNDNTSFLNFDFIDTKDINDFKVSLYKRRDGQFQIFSFRGTSTPSNIAFDIFTIGGNIHRYQQTFDEILTFIKSFKNDTKTYITGQSMGGFLAQVFSVLSDSEGLSISGPSAVNFLKRHYYNEYQNYIESGRKFHNLGVQGDVVPKIKSRYGHLGNELESIHSDIEPPKYSEFPRALFGVHLRWP